MTEFSLSRIHPGYHDPIKDILGELMRQYPEARLKQVKLYPFKSGDRSMANVNERDTIALNPYWFTRSPSRLAEAARSRTAMPLGNGANLAYHGRMVEEPLHVLTHEFGHVLQFSVMDGWEKFIEPLLGEARKNPSLAPAAYGLINPTEYFAELFAATHLGLATGPHVDAMRQALTEFRA